MTEDIKITFYIDNPIVEGDDRIFNLKLYTPSWALSLKLNSFLFYPASKINAVLDMIYRSQDAPKAFGILKMCLDYLLSVYDNETNEYKKELKKIKSCYRAIEKYEAYYHLYTEGS